MSGKESFVCHLSNNREDWDCEDWAYHQREMAPGGVLYIEFLRDERGSCIMKYIKKIDENFINQVRSGRFKVLEFAGEAILTNQDFLEKVKK